MDSPLKTLIGLRRHHHQRQRLQPKSKQTIIITRLLLGINNGTKYTICTLILVSFKQTEGDMAKCLGHRTPNHDDNFGVSL